MDFYLLGKTTHLNQIKLPKNNCDEYYTLKKTYNLYTHYLQ